LNVIDEDNDTEIRVHSGDFAELRSKGRIREEFLQKRDDEATFSNKRTRRMKGADEEQETIDRNKKPPYSPFIPKFLFNTIKDQDLRTNLSKWRRMTNNESQYKKLIERVAEAGNVVEETRSQELYNMLLNSVADGHALYLVEKARDDNGKVECGYTAWKALHDWYLSRE